MYTVRHRLPLLLPVLGFLPAFLAASIAPVRRLRIAALFLAAVAPVVTVTLSGGRPVALGFAVVAGLVLGAGVSLPDPIRRTLLMTGAPVLAVLALQFAPPSWLAAVRDDAYGSPRYYKRLAGARADAGERGLQWLGGKGQ